MYFGGKVSVFSGYINKRAVVKSEFVAEISFLYKVITNYLTKCINYNCFGNFECSITNNFYPALD